MTIQPIPGAGPDPRDQPQRSLLAWRRTALALVVIGLLLAKAAAAQPVALAIGVGAELCAIAAFISSQRRLAEPRSALASPPSAFPQLLLTSITTGVMAVGVAALALTT